MSNISTWNALYQQRPAPMEGALFHEDWFEIVPMPAGRFRRVVRRWDTAATDPKDMDDPDWTVGLKLGEHEDGLYYILDVVRFRKSPGKTEAEIKRVTEKDGRIRFRIEREPGSQGKLYARYLSRTIFRGKAFRAIPSTGNKMLRAEEAAAAAERGEVKLVRGHWNRPFLREVRHFPFGTHDDQVDAFSGAFEDLNSRATRMWTA